MSARLSGQAGSIVIGTVTTADAWPLPGATVTVLGSDGVPQGHASTDADGSFQITGLTAGPATFIVAAPAHDPNAMAVNIPDSARWEMGTVTLVRTGAGLVPPPGIWVIDSEHSSVRARAHHLGFGGVSGGFEEFGGMIVVDERIETSRVDVQLRAASIYTANAQRDAHLRSADFLDVDRFPTLSYTSSSVTRHGDGWLVHGSLNLRGVNRLVDLQMSYLGSGPDPWGGTRAGFKATAQLRRQDFDMNWNQAVSAGIDALGTTLRITIDIEAVLQA